MGEEVPSWLTEKVVVEVLNSLEKSNEDIKVNQYQCEVAVPPGSNFMSCLYRVTVKYETQATKDIKSTTFVVKTPLKPGEMKTFVDKLGSFEKERKLYFKIFPKLYQLQSTRITAKPFNSSLRESLVLEDLKAGGYTMTDRIKQLDFQHCQCFLATLARLHALSFITYKKHPEIELQKIGRKLFFDDKIPDYQVSQKGMSIIFLKALLKTVELLKGCENYACKIRKVDPAVYWENVLKLTKRGNCFNVLNHGDTWTANILFKYNDGGKVIDAKLVDFQLSSFSSFAFDLFYFWWSSANETVRELHREELFGYYRDSLNSTFEELGSQERLSKEDFDIEIRTVAPYSVLLLSTILPVAMADPDDFLVYNELGPGEFFTGETFDYNSPQLKNHRSKYYYAVLPKMLQQVEEIGAFD